MLSGWLKILRYSKEEVSFNLMAIIKNKKMVYQQEMSQLREEKDAIQKQIDSMGGT